MRTEPQTLEQALIPLIDVIPIDMILAGFEKFNQAVTKRIQPHEYTAEHQREINRLRTKFFGLEIELEQLKKETF